MTNNTGLSPKDPSKYLGPNVYISVVVSRNRSPTGADYRQPETGKNYPFGTYWLVGINPTTGVYGDLWYLANIVSNVGNWIKLSSGTSGPVLGFVVPFGSSPVVPAANGLVTYTSTLGTVVITGSTNTINFDVNGGQPVTNFIVQANTAPGTNPVLPSASGAVTINGAAVAAHSVPIETRSRAANAYNVEVQYSSAVAATDATKSGIAHFNSAQFSVDANGFVSITSGSNNVIRQVFTANGTYTPTVGMKQCDVQIIGGGGAGGGAPAPAAGEVSVGTGGSAGEYAVGLFSAATIGASQAITIGAGGVAVLGATGGNGTTTSLGALMTAFGGLGGPASVAGVNVAALTPASGGTGGTGGDYRTPGATPGIRGFASFTIAIVEGSAGADSQLGSGGVPTGSPMDGSAGTGYGAGGSGAGASPGGSAQTGGNGAPGIVIITEYL